MKTTKILTILVLLFVLAMANASSAVSKIYWTDINARKIKRANLDGSGIEDLVTTGLSLPYSIAVDTAGGKMYWTDNEARKIQRANLDGSGIENLVTTGLSRPYGIAVDIAGGKMYWTDAGTRKVQRANLDGTGVEDLVTTGLSQPYSIAVDIAGGKMYWTDAGTRKIQRANLDGSGIEDLVTTGLSRPIGIAVDIAGGEMYWTDYGIGKMQRANLDGSGVEDIITAVYPAGIALVFESTAFTYQGRLIDGDKPADGLYDFQFKLFDDPNVILGNQIGNNVNQHDVDVIDGYFTVELAFRSGVFDGSARWLEIDVRPGEMNDPNVYTVLEPRQEITPTPYALYAKNAGAGHSLDAADGSPTNAVYVDNAGKVGIGTTTPLGELHVHGDPAGSIKISGKEQNYSALVMVTNIESLNPANWGTWKFWKFSAHGDKYAGQYNANELAVQYCAPGSGVEDVMLLQPGGNVGIGTINPNSKLEVDGIVHSTAGGFKFPDGTMQTSAATAGALVSVDGVSNPGGDVDFVEGDNITITPNPAGNSITFSSPADGHSLNAADGSPIDAVYVDADGSVGIGTTSPQKKLHVYAGEDTSNVLWGQDIQNGGSAQAMGGCGAGIRFKNCSYSGADDPYKWAGIASRAETDWSWETGLSFYTQLNAQNHIDPTIKMVITGGGDVGIGTPAPQAKLDVNGDIHTTGEFTKEFTTGTSNRATPIAYAFISKNGSVASGTPNVSSTWNAVGKLYEITISGENYYYSSYVTVVTPCGGAYVTSTGSSSPKLIVKIYDLTGSLVQGYFQFVTYKP